MSFEYVTFPGLVKFWYFYETLVFFKIFTSFCTVLISQLPQLLPPMFYLSQFNCPFSEVSSTPGNSALWEAGKGKGQVLGTSARNRNALSHWLEVKAGGHPRGHFQP